MPIGAGVCNRLFLHNLQGFLGMFTFSVFGTPVEPGSVPVPAGSPMAVEGVVTQQPFCSPNLPAYELAPLPGSGPPLTFFFGTLAGKTAGSDLDGRTQPGPKTNLRPSQIAGPNVHQAKPVTLPHLGQALFREVSFYGNT